MLFFDMYFPRLFRFVLRRSAGDGELAKELVHQSMAWHSAART